MDLLRSLPIGTYLEEPTTWLHRLDPRVKLLWLMTFLLTPLLAGFTWRLVLVIMLVLLTSTAIPLRVWRQQMGLLSALCFVVFAVTAVMPDGLAAQHQPRLPSQELSFVATTETSSQAVPLSAEVATRQPNNPLFDYFRSYRYILFQAGPIKVTRRSLELGFRLGSLLFTLIYGTTLYLLTTAPEEITTTLDLMLQPLRRWRIPVTELTLTLTLALRFIPLVLEEVQNLVRSVRTRAINWKKLGVKGASQIWLLLADRLLENLFLRAEQIASAMQVRGFTAPNQHHVQWSQLQIRFRDWVALLLVFGIWGLRIWMGIDT
ncbi:MAG: CbiQ family ECF transporter T component [Cyanobacteria bacterium P01_A01_bin.17]